MSQESLWRIDEADIKVGFPPLNYDWASGSLSIQASGDREGKVTW